MPGFDNYDAWKTASPCDDEPDPIEEGEKFCARFRDADSPDLLLAVAIIDALLAEI